MKLILQLAGTEDLAAATEFLTRNNLPVSDLAEDNVQLYLAYDDQHPVASIGLEKHGKNALLRSLAVKESHRNKQLADRMIKGFFALCEAENITEVYLLTTTAEKYFLKKGFRQVDRTLVPPEIQHSREFRSICPSSAVVMHRQVRNG